MSDQTKYINAYVESAVAFTHEYLNTILQLKTQLKLVNDLIVEKDAQINQLSLQLQKSNLVDEDVSKLSKQVEELQKQNFALSNKSSHIDTFSKQISEMKRDIGFKNEEIASLKLEIEAFNNPKKSIINKKKKSKSLDEMVIQPLIMADLENPSLPMVDDF